MAVQKVEKNMLRLLDPGEFVQGTIFTCGLSDSYPDEPALGMLITARCDTAQDKAEVYNYIPIVPVEAWIKKDALEIVAKRALANGLGGMKSALSDAGMAPSIVDFVEHNLILNELRAGTSKQEKSIATRFEQALKAMRSASEVLEKTDRSAAESLSFLAANDGLYRGVIKDLLTNALAECHYLERSEIGEETKGYVALMREIRFMSAALGKRIAVGLDAKEFESLAETFSPGLNHVRFSPEHDFAMPLSCISSPYIEFIMQRFANLFSRIGVADIPKDRITEAHSWVKVMQGNIG
jgi:arsenate reductase-like glutaredoxin family protein